MYTGWRGGSGGKGGVVRRLGREHTYDDANPGTREFFTLLPAGTFFFFARFFALNEAPYAGGGATNRLS